MASCHGPTARGDRIAAGIDVLRQLPDPPPAPQPGQDVLDQVVRSLLAAASTS